MIEKPCASYKELVWLGERELVAFIGSVTELFGADQARAAAEDWLEAIAFLDCYSSRPSHSWQLVTIAATTKFLNRVITKNDLRDYASSQTLWIYPGVAPKSSDA